MSYWRRRARTIGVGAVLVIATSCASVGTVETSEAAADEITATVVATTEAVEDQGPVATPTAVSIAEMLAPPRGPEAATAAPSQAQAAAPEPSPASESPAAPPTAIPRPTGAPVAGSAQVLAANGGEVYTLNCARCHAENGFGTDQYSATLFGVGRTYSNAAMIEELTNGHPVTFGFADRLSAEEIASVVAYVRATFP